jgi:hypothetical protein
MTAGRISRLPTVMAVAAMLAGGAGALAQAPVPVAERSVTHLGRTTRISLFSNHVAVVTIRSDVDDFVHQATLRYDEYMVYLQALASLAPQIDEDAISSDVESVDSVTVLTLYVGPGGPRTITYSPLASLSLSAGKVASIMDDIQLRVLNTRPGEDELRRWRPEVGDRVELLSGAFAVVSATADDGTVVLVEDSTSVMVTVHPDNRAEVILRLVALHR